MPATKSAKPTSETPTTETAIEWAIRTRPTAAYAFLRAYYRVRTVEDRELTLAWNSVAAALGAGEAIGVEGDDAPVDPNGYYYSRWTCHLCSRSGCGIGDTPGAAIDDANADLRTHRSAKHSLDGGRRRTRSYAMKGGSA